MREFMRVQIWRALMMLKPLILLELERHVIRSENKRLQDSFLPNIDPLKTCNQTKATDLCSCNPFRLRFLDRKLCQMLLMSMYVLQ